MGLPSLAQNVKHWDLIVNEKSNTQLPIGSMNISNKQDKCCIQGHLMNPIHLPITNKFFKSQISYKLNESDFQFNSPILGTDDMKFNP